jgi:hypothetical protein
MKKLLFSILILSLIYSCKPDEPNDILKRLTEIRNTKATSDLDILFDSIDYQIKVDTGFNDSTLTYVPKVDTGHSVYTINKTRDYVLFLTTDTERYFETLKALKARDIKEVKTSTYNESIYTSFESNDYYINLVRGVYGDRRMFSVLLQGK